MNFADAGEIKLKFTFGITHMQFFDTEADKPGLLCEVYDELRALSEEDLRLLLRLIRRLKQ